MEPKAAWEIAEEGRATEAAEAVSKFTNSMGFRGSLFINAMARQHRTLQQSFTRICLLWLHHLSKLPEGHYDLRNEASVKIAKELFKGRDEYTCCLPSI